MTVKTRFAPSPTGYLHVGGARTALYSWLFAKNQGGEFVLRIEDTDLERNSQEAVDAILEGMQWMGMEWDEGPYFQSKRFDRYNEMVDKLLAEDKAYKCYASKELLDEIRAEQEANKEMARYDANHPKVVAANAAAKILDCELEPASLIGRFIKRTSGRPTVPDCLLSRAIGLIQLVDSSN